MDAASCHWTTLVTAKLRSLRVHRVCIPISLTWKYQLIDVIVVAQFKNVLYNLWSKWMLHAIEFGHFREASWNYIAPSRAKVIEWVLLAWEGPESRVTEATILKGAKWCYMSQDLD